jgi:hypothetical protein
LGLATETSIVLPPETFQSTSTFRVSDAAPNPIAATQIRGSRHERTPGLIEEDTVAPQSIGYTRRQIAGTRTCGWSELLGFGVPGFGSRRHALRLRVLERPRSRSGSKRI